MTILLAIILLACHRRCEPWPSALAMSAELLGRPHLVARQRVCELGCGLGLAGLAAAVAGAFGRETPKMQQPAAWGVKYPWLPFPGHPAQAMFVVCNGFLPCLRFPWPGAAEVVLLDREPLALQCALVNAEINGLAVAAPQPSSSSSSSGGSSSVLAPPLEQLLQYLPAEDVQRLQEHRQQLALQRERLRAAAPSSSGGGGSSGSSGSSGSTELASPAAEAAAAAAAVAALPPPSGVVRAEVFDWSQPVTIAPHDVMLVCDCLYESFSVQVGRVRRCSRAMACILCSGDSLLEALVAARVDMLSPCLLCCRCHAATANAQRASFVPPLPCPAAGCGGGSQAAQAPQRQPPAAGRPARPRAAQQVCEAPARWPPHGHLTG